MPDTLRARAKAWRHRSVRNRLLWLSLGSTAGLALLLGLGAFPLFLFQAWQNHQDRVDNQIDAAHAQIDLRIAALRQSVEALSRNSFLVNAFIDSSGRDIYLRPTLRDFGLPFGGKAQLVLLDTNLEPFATNLPAMPAVHWQADTVRRALASGRSQVLVQPIDDAERLVLVVPVYYPPTSHHEGVIVATLPLTEVLGRIQLPDEAGQCLVVFTSRRNIVNGACAGTERFLRVATMRSNIEWSQSESAIQRGADGGGGDALDLAVGFQGSAWQPWRAVAGVFAIYGAAAVLALGLMYAVISRAVRPFSREVEQLERTFRDLAADPAANTRAAWPIDDEIGRMSEAFNLMLDKNQALRTSLETRVQQRTAELALARDEAQAASRAKSVFIATMSHEIRTPLNGVLGMNELLLRSKLDPRQREHAEHIRSSGRHLLDLLNDVLDLSRLEAGALPIDNQAFEVPALFAELEALFHALARQRGLRLNFRVDPPADVPMLGDRLRLRQVMLNLIGNALKFTERGGVTVTAAAQAQDAGVLQLHLEVVDTGIGIAPEAQSLIFDAFTQADDSMSRQYDGSGLGLTICRRLARAMGGEIGLHSTLGEGSSFFIDLNLHRAPAEARPPDWLKPSDFATRFATPHVGQVAGAAVAAPVAAGTPNGAASLRGLTALLAEDNDVNALVAEAFLAEMGVTCQRARNGIEVLRQLDILPRPDIVLMDCQMPGMDGFEAAQRWRAIESARGDSARLPILAITANTLEVDLARARQSGMDDLLCKPFSHEKLLRMLLQWLPEPRASGSH